MRKFLFIVLFLVPASLYAACSGVAVQQSGVLIAKEVYCGDTSNLSAAEAARSAADGTLSFTNTVLPSAAFDALQVPADQNLKNQLINDRFNILNSTNTAAQKIQALIDFLQVRGELN